MALRTEARRRVIAAAGALVFLGVLAGATQFGGSLPVGPKPGGELGGRAGLGASASATALDVPPLTTLVPEGSDAVVRAYLRFWQVAQAVDRRPRAQWRPALEAVVGEPLLDELLDGLDGQAARGTLQYGTVTPHPTVADLGTDRATVVDCQDVSHSGEIDRETGAVRKVGSARTPVSAVLRQERGSWLVTEARYFEGPC